MQMRNFAFWILVFLLLGCRDATNKSVENSSGIKGLEVNAWITTADRTKLLAPSSLNFYTEQGGTSVITIDTATQYQTMDGFGFSLTGGSAQLINQKLNANDRSSLLRELFLAEGNGIGISYLRISM